MGDEDILDAIAKSIEPFAKALDNLLDAVTSSTRTLDELVMSQEDDEAEKNNVAFRLTPERLERILRGIP